MIRDKSRSPSAHENKAQSYRWRHEYFNAIVCHHHRGAAKWNSHRFTIAAAAREREREREIKLPRHLIAREPIGLDFRCLVHRLLHQNQTQQ
jgi:hypothetical protein